MKHFALLLLLLATATAFAQAPTRVRGTITGLDGDVLSVESREGKDLKLGESICTNARQEADGKIVAERLNVSKDGVRPPH